MEIYLSRRVWVAVTLRRGKASQRKLTVAGLTSCQMARVRSVSSNVLIKPNGRGVSPQVRRGDRGIAPNRSGLVQHQAGGLQGGLI